MKDYIQRLIVLLKRLSVLFILYQVMRLIFFFYNRHHFPEVGFRDMLRLMYGGFRFDLTAILYLNLLYILLYLLPVPFRTNKLYKRTLFILFMLTNALGFAFNLMDIFYFDFVLKRSTVEVFMFAGEKNMGSLMLQFMQDFWLGFVLFALFVYIIYKWYRYIDEPKPIRIFNKHFYLKGITLLLVSLFFVVIGIRGSFIDDRPLHMNNAGAYIKQPLEMAIVLNTPFAIIRTWQKQTFTPKHYFSKEEVAKIFNPVKHFSDDTIMVKKNVMILIIESFAKEYTGLLNRDIKAYKGYTPFMDSLMLQTHTFVNAYANGRKSIDAMPSTLTSVPSLVQPYVLSPYGADKLYGLGTVLKKEGYKTAFFHGAPNGSMAFNAFVKLAGLDEYYGMTEYNNDADYDGHWGIPDDKFLQYTAQTLDTFKQPFFTTLFTLSSHHPYKLPPGFEGKFKGGPLEIHKVIQYMDFSMKHFFETASKKPWFHNTIFVITADHCNQTYLPEYNSSLGHHAIPIIIYEPGKPNDKVLDSTLTQQVDIMPRILRRLFYQGKILSFGNDPRTDKHPFVVNYSGGTWEYMQDDYLLRFRNEKVTGFYNYKKDRLLKNNLLDHPPVPIAPMERKLKAFIQQYINRLIENRLTPDDE